MVVTRAMEFNVMFTIMTIVKIQCDKNFIIHYFAKIIYNKVASIKIISQKKNQRILRRRHPPFIKIFQISQGAHPNFLEKSLHFVELSCKSCQKSWKLIPAKVMTKTNAKTNEKYAHRSLFLIGFGASNSFNFAQKLSWQ